MAKEIYNFNPLEIDCGTKVAVCDWDRLSSREKSPYFKEATHLYDKGIRPANGFCIMQGNTMLSMINAEIKPKED